MINNPRLGNALAEAISRDTGIVDERLLQVFASVPRECFVGAPPWLIAPPSYDGAAGATYEQTDDPYERRRVGSSLGPEMRWPECWATD